MQITIECPDCGEVYHLNADTVGKKMRCTNAMCQEIFEIKEPKAPPPKEVVPASTPSRTASTPPPPPPAYQSGNIGDIVPVLDAEILDVVEFDEDDNLIRNLDLEPLPKPKEKAKPKKAPQPKVVAWSADMEAPPPKVRADDDLFVPELVEDADEIVEDDPEPATDAVSNRRSRRRKKRNMLLFVVLGAAVLGAAGYGASTLIWIENETEVNLAEAAKKKYDERDYNGAITLYDKLIQSYPQSGELATYQFFQGISTLKKTIHSALTPSDPKPAFEAVKVYVTEHADDPMLAPADKYGFDLYESLQKLSEDVVTFAEKRLGEKKYDESEASLDDTETLLSVMEKYKPANITGSTMPERIAAVRKAIAVGRQYIVDIAWLDEKAVDPTEESLIEMGDFIIAKNLGKDAKAMTALQTARSNFQKKIRYIADKPPVPSTPQGEPTLPGLLAVPLVERGPGIPAGASPGTGAVFFALARGVLYALDEADGRPLWATRAGIDADILPLYVPGTDSNPELVLLPTNDGKQFGLAARLARTGQPLWFQPLDAPALGRPVLFGRRAFVPMRDNLGSIAVIEIASGSRLGILRVNNRLGVGGAKHPEKGLLFFPADSAQVFVFDVDKYNDEGVRLDPICIGILPTAHPARSLRGPAIVLGSEETGAQTTLLLTQADGIDRMRLRSFPLPASDAPTPWGDIPSVDAVLNGWSWLAPFCDGEKLALITERGDFGLFGVRQAGNSDRPLFPLTARPFGVDGTGLVARTADAPASFSSIVPTRGQVVYADESRFWVVAGGSLSQIEMGLTSGEGPLLVQRGTSNPIGTPLHDGQVSPKRDLAVAVTQAGSVCLATAIDTYTGKIRWTRQLGAIPAGESFAVDSGVVLLDQSGGLFWFPKFTKPIPPEVEWSADEYWQVAPPIREAAGPPTLLRKPDGKSVLSVIATEGKARQLIVRSFTPGQRADGARTVNLPSPLAGPPILLGDTHLILPLRDGNLHRFRLKDGKALEAGPTWRQGRLNESATCHLTPFGEGEFLASNGDRALIGWKWPADGQFEAMWQMSLIEKIARPALVLPRGAADPFRAVVADVKGNVILYEGDKLEVLVRAWRPAGANPLPGGKVTAGPFARATANGLRVGYVVNGANLVWVDPADDRAKWVFPAKGIVGESAVVGDRVWVTAGDKVVALEEATGKVARTEALPGGLVPAGAAVPLATVEGARLLVPLADGTLALVPQEREKPKE